MICDDDLQEWLPTDIYLQFQRQTVVQRGDWILNRDTVESNIRWYAKPNGQVLLLQSSDGKVVRYSKKAYRYYLYEIDSEGNETLKDQSYSLYNLGRPPSTTYRGTSAYRPYTTTYSTSYYGGNYISEDPNLRNKQIVSLAQSAKRIQENYMA